MENLEILLDDIKDAAAKFSDENGEPDFRIDIRIQCEDGWVYAEVLEGGNI